MNKYIWLLLIFPLVFSCDLSGVNDDDQGVENDDLYEEPVAVAKDSLVFDNGIVIRYFEHGAGDSLRKGDVVKIDYSCWLKDGNIFDSNEKIGKPIPFMVGWSMQTKGWDLAFEQLRVGDDVEIFLPAELARGKAGIPGSVPPNSDNWLRVKVVEKMKEQHSIDGVKVYVFERLPNAQKLKIGDEVEIEYIAYAESKPRYSSSFQNGAPFSFKLGSGSNLPGLNMGMEFACHGDLLWIYIPSTYAFGKKGSVDNVKPNEAVLFDVLVYE
jgi:FKBP-type peptidyl-prolyl cis-trans isomerase FkpA